MVLQSYHCLVNPLNLSELGNMSNRVFENTVCILTRLSILYKIMSVLVHMALHR